MVQDTRKDPRAKVLTMTVRYKSATVDEFIENHSHDVSRGGIFIKTGSPFPPGTLLKFEIRIAQDRSILGGVGRVVWKRDGGQSGDGRPTGMGVKFLKIDDGSRQIIDRIVDTQDGQPSAFDMGDTSTGSKPAVKSQKATMLGLGAIKAEDLLDGAVGGDDEGEGEGFFPATNSEKEMPPPAERTVMKQAAELLAEALKGAGGSMDEIGSTGPSIAEKELAKAREDATAKAELEAELAKPEELSPEPVLAEPKPVEVRVKSDAPEARDSVKPAAVSARPVEAKAPASVRRIEPESDSSGSLKTIGMLAVVAAIAGLAWYWYTTQMQGKEVTPPEVTKPVEAPKPVVPAEPVETAKPVETTVTPPAPTSSPALPVVEPPKETKPAEPTTKPTPAVKPPSEPKPPVEAPVKPVEPEVPPSPPKQPKPPAQPKPAPESDNPY